MRADRATGGATHGNIIAAIITTQTPMNQPNPPRPLHGPLSMPRISRTVHHQPTAASAKRATMRPACARMAPYAGRRPGPPTVSVSGIDLGGPGEVRLRQARLALVGDAESVD